MAATNARIRSVPSASPSPCTPASAIEAVAAEATMSGGHQPRPWRNSRPGVAPVHTPLAKVSTPLTTMDW